MAIRITIENEEDKVGQLEAIREQIISVETVDPENPRGEKTMLGGGETGTFYVHDEIHLVIKEAKVVRNGPTL